MVCLHFKIKGEKSSFILSIRTEQAHIPKTAFYVEHDTTQNLYFMTFFFFYIYVLSPRAVIFCSFTYDKRGINSPQNGPFYLKQDSENFRLFLDVLIFISILFSFIVKCHFLIPPRDIMMSSPGLYVLLCEFA